MTNLKNIILILISSILIVGCNIPRTYQYFMCEDCLACYKHKNGVFAFGYDKEKCRICNGQLKVLQDDFEYISNTSLINYKKEDIKNSPQ